MRQRIGDQIFIEKALWTNPIERKNTFKVNFAFHQMPTPTFYTFVVIFHAIKPPPSSFIGLIAVKEPRLNTAI
ncbi:hypothetical protein VI03_18715 [Burkholderia vietnamiensis]|nr:hypothetical protein VI03_18715 [Burkholderia vietnamiensis]